MRFEHQRGKYMMHCHNLVHEDHDMMAQFQVGDDGGLHNPVRADPCKNLPAGALFTRPPRDDDGRGGDSGSGSSGSAAGPSPRPLAPRSPNTPKFTRKPKKKRKTCKPASRKARRRNARAKKVVRCKPAPRKAPKRKVARHKRKRKRR